MIKTFWKEKNLYTWNYSLYFIIPYLNAMVKSHSMTNEFYLTKTLSFFIQEDRDYVPKIMDGIMTTVRDLKLNHNRTWMHNRRTSTTLEEEHPETERDRCVFFLKRWWLKQTNVKPTSAIKDIWRSRKMSEH